MYVSTTEQFQRAISQGVDPKTIEIAPAGALDAAENGKRDERQRCQTIMEIAGQDHPDKARHAIESGMSAEALGTELFRLKLQGGQRKADEPKAVDAITAKWNNDQQNH
ncbi:hypothetical protein [Halomonas sp. LBP4]|uniref:hypothetical protein n=1 Tax=Halomonas sp. LBP4 TaxID=2044917 RepID=UPI000D75FB06|nr:hypothetical protein [Halomonas sp. LBP4]PXX94997.1 hypothetical protein CR157_20500 [Halomonas sp. LBP4]